MALKPQDVLVLLKWALHPTRKWTVRALAEEVGLSPGETFSCNRRLVEARLLAPGDEESGSLVPLRQNVVEFLVHGLKYSFPPERGGLTRGVPTAHAAPVLRGHFSLPKEAQVPVWPDAEGKLRGEAFEPLYKSAVKAAAADQSMYAALALVDAIRGGNARDRELAAGLLERMVMEARLEGARAERSKAVGDGRRRTMGSRQPAESNPRSPPPSGRGRGAGSGRDPVSWRRGQTRTPPPPESGEGAR